MDKKGRGESDKRIWAAVKGIGVYTIAFIVGEKERWKGTERGEQGLRMDKMMETKVQDLAEDLGMKAEAGEKELAKKMEQEAEELASRHTYT